MSQNRRSVLLLGLVVVLVVLVAFDRMSGSSDETTSASAASRYAEQSSQLAQLRRVVDAAPEWRASLDASDEAFNEARAGMIEAVSAELAAARLRDRVAAELRRLGMTLDFTQSPSPRTPVDGVPIRVIALQARFKSPNPTELYQLIERLETSEDVRMNIARLVVTGPGQSAGRGLSVDMTIEALALVGREASS